MKRRFVRREVAKRLRQLGYTHILEKPTDTRKPWQGRKQIGRRV